MADRADELLGRAAPKTVRAFQIRAMMGIMILMIALIIGVVLAVGTVPSYWNHGIIADLNPAEKGSDLLAQLAPVKSFSLWLDPLRMLGMAFLFTAITLALTVVIRTLRMQATILQSIK